LIRKQYIQIKLKKKEAMIELPGGGARSDVLMHSLPSGILSFVPGAISPRFASLKCSLFKNTPNKKERN